MKAKIDEIIEEIREQGIIGICKSLDVTSYFSEKEKQNNKILCRLSQAKCYY